MMIGYLLARRRPICAAKALPYLEPLLKPLKEASTRQASNTITAFLVLIALLFCALPSTAESVLFGGKITDSSGSLIPGVKVTLHNGATGEELIVTSDRQGFYHFQILTSGVYRLQAQYSGFKTYVVDELHVDTQRSRTLDISMQVGSNAETIRVDGTLTEINRENATVGSTLTRELLENQPLSSRSLQSLLTLVPGVVQITAPSSTAGNPNQFSVNGQRADSNIFVLDGVSANLGAAVTSGNGLEFAAGSAPTVNALGGTQSMINLDALETIRVNTATYSAEYGRSPGGQFLLTSRAGGSNYHATGYEYFRNEILDANDWFANNEGIARGKLRQHLYGGTAGGPLPFSFFRKTFFFAAFESLQLVQPETMRSLIPGASLRQSAASGFQPLLNALPEPNGVAAQNGWYYHTYQLSRPKELYSGSLRLDRTFASRLHAFVRYSKSPSDSSSDANLLTRARTHTDSESLTTGITWTPAAKLVNETRLNWSTGSYGSQYFTAEGVNLFSLLPADFGTKNSYANFGYADGYGTISLTQGHFGGLNPFQVNITDSVSWRKNRHELKFGIDLRWLRPAGISYDARASLSVSKATDLAKGIVSSATLYSNVDGRPTFANYSAYLQDNWKLSPRLTADFGLRWDVSPAPGSANGIQPFVLTSSDFATMKIDKSSKTLYATRFTNLAPRVGFNYQLGRASGWESILRLGGGFFYDTGNQAAAMVYKGLPFGNSTIKTSVALASLKTVSVPPTVANLTAPYTGTLYAMDPNLKAPLTYQWSLGAEQNLGRRNLLKISYVGNTTRYLLNTGYLNLNLKVNPDFKFVYLTQNRSDSSYNALQVEFHGRTNSHLQQFVSYVWSHSLDNSVMDQTSGRYNLLKGNSDGNLPHSFRAGISLDGGRISGPRLFQTVVSNWGIDLNITMQSGFPFDVTAKLSTLPDGSYYYSYPDVVPGVAQWIRSPKAPGGYQLNPDAFRAAAGSSGTLTRNSIHGFAVGQANLSLRRTFSLTEKAGLQLRAEFYNLTNHPNFGNYENSFSATSPSINSVLGQATEMYGSSLGGLNSLYQTGGARSMQLVARVSF